MKSLRIGNGAGFWGDNLDAPVQLAERGQLDVLTLEYLAELTMAILAHLRSKNPQAGYVTDFVELMPRLVELWKSNCQFRVVTNAGGLNPLACARQVGSILTQAGFGDSVVSAVAGDDVLPLMKGWMESGSVDLSHFETGEPFNPAMIDRLICANVYQGARLIADSWRNGSQIIITGRVADASLTLGPAVGEFGWGWDQWNYLAGASAAGHIIECGAQATGGLWHQWEDVDYVNLGYPIAEVRSDGSSIITKPEGTGGLVTVSNVTEQLVYEIDDPGRYRTPDVDVDLTTIGLSDNGADQVLVEGAKGQPPSQFLKLSAVYRDGWTASGFLAYVGERAEAKARAAGQILLERVKRAGFDLDQSLVECFGAGDIVPGAMTPTTPPWEVVLRVTARDSRKPAIERFCREFAPLILSGPPGAAGYASGRPEPRPAFAYWPALIPRLLVESGFQVETKPARTWAGGFPQG